MKHIKKYNELLDPMGKWSSDENSELIDNSNTSELVSSLSELINVGRTSVDSISNIKNSNGVITFDALIRGVWMVDNDAVYQIRNSLLKHYSEVSVDKVKGKSHNFEIKVK